MVYVILCNSGQTHSVRTKFKHGSLNALAKLY